MPGTLYVVATPIGNLEDITFRAVRVLKECGRIACEDTRQTHKLLNHFGIRKPLVSCHEFNEAGRAAELTALLEAGETIALVSDAGTPLISDPGYRLINAALEAGVPVVPVPGPSALLAALSASGLPSDEFHFGGFLPAKAGQRRNHLMEVAGYSGTMIFYEAPHRILETLEDVAKVFPHHPLVVARELTKVHEEFLRGTAEEIRGKLEARGGLRGEFTLLIGRCDRVRSGPVDEAGVREAVAALEAGGVSRMEAMKRVARERGLGKREVYRMVESQS